MKFETRQRKRKSRDWTGKVLTHGVVLGELGVYDTHSYWKVKCNHCDGEHSLTVKQMDADVWTNKCPAFRSHNYQGFTSHNDARLFREFGIRQSDYDLMLVSQKHSCAICSKHISEEKRAFHVDHCHTTGKVRGLLCSNCNRALGYFKDSTHNLQQAITYLQRHTAPVPAR